MLCGIIYWPLLYISIGHCIDSFNQGENIFNDNAKLYSLFIVVIDQLSRIINLYCRHNFKFQKTNNNIKKESTFTIMKSMYVSFKRTAPFLIYFLLLSSSIDYFIVIFLLYSTVGFIFIIITNYLKISKL